MDIRDIYSSPSDRGRFQKDIEQHGFVKDYEVKFVTRDRTEIECLLSSTLRMSPSEKSSVTRESSGMSLIKRKLSRR